MITYENPKMTKSQREYLVGKHGHPMTWSRYHRYPDMIRYMEFLLYSFPHLVELITIGRSSEGLPLKVIKISHGNDASADGVLKPSFWVDGGMHGREWIGPATVLYIVRELVEHSDRNKHLLELGDWYLMPVVNPDGYEFSHSTDRLWSKSRSNHQGASSILAGRFFTSACRGVDLNRNFDFHWGEIGVSDDPCHLMYAGPRPFSEPETRAVADFILDQKDKLMMYLTLHSYSQMWLVPWSHSKEKATDYEELVDMAKRAVNAMKRISHTTYEIGTSPSLMFATSGGAVDWAKGVAGIKYAYQVELGDKGTYGFIFPATHILTTAKQIFSAVKAMTKDITDF